MLRSALGTSQRACNTAACARQWSRTSSGSGLSTQSGRTLPAQRNLTGPLKKTHRHKTYPVHGNTVAADASPPGGSGGGTGAVGTGGSGEGGQWPLGTGLFALLLFAGGAMGYIKKKSKKSAIAGGASGAIMLLAALLMRSPGTLKLGFCIACGTTLGLLVVMGMRFSKSKKFMPAGLLATLSAVWSALYLTSGVIF